jgi:hypothetical protein
MQTQKKAMNVGTDQQLFAKTIDGMGGVMNEKHLEVRVMGQQTSVEVMVPLVPIEIVKEEQVEVGEDIRETSKGNANEIEIDLERTILMIKDQENAIHVAPLLEQENTN